MEESRERANELVRESSQQQRRIPPPPPPSLSVASRALSLCVRASQVVSWQTIKPSSRVNCSGSVVIMSVPVFVFVLCVKMCVSACLCLCAWVTGRFEHGSEVRTAIELGQQWAVDYVAEQARERAVDPEREAGGVSVPMDTR